MSAYATRARILQEMDRRRLPVWALARKLGWHRDALVALLGGRRALTRSEVRDIAAALGVADSVLLLTGSYRCDECGSIGSAPTHRRDCSQTSAAASAPAPAAAELHLRGA